ncbi:type I-C CRISPR-associated protein Cas5 [Clostridiales bacterium]|nr:type I-C CRISPR-associated protein Cas5 [Clostridiales bacterium]
MGFMVEVWGKYALFTRPEMKVERVSYDVMTPSAARGLLEAIYWHPGIQWVVDKIYVLNPIRFTNIRRNEVSAKASASKARSVMTGGKGELYLCTQECIQQRASMLLEDVHYVIEAHFVITEKASPEDNHGKITDIVHRRLKKGQCYHQPYLGTREFPANFREWSGEELKTAYPNDRRDLGFMLYDMDYSDPENIRPQFFRAVLDSGVLNLTDCEVFT